jgi:hypothetical protein
MDGTIKETQELRRLLEKARQYWTTNWQRDPVWIVARGACETNTRYAYVMDYSAERDDNPYNSPFYGDSLSTMDEWTLDIERSDWLNNPPGQGSCVAIASQQTYWSATDTDTSSPTQSEDDAEVIVTATSISLIAQHTHLGVDGLVVYASGIRFRNVAIPAGATITSARIDVVATDADGTSDTSWQVYGELNAAPAIFSTYANFMGRALTTNSSKGTTTLGWTIGATYTILRDTASSRALLQEVVDLGGWAAGNDLAVLIFDDGSKGYHRYAAWDDALAEPILYLEWTTGETAPIGRSATCTNEVYFANKHNKAQITHVYYYDASTVTYTGNQIGAVLPYYLYPNPTDAPPTVPAAGDIFYAGIETALLDSGPFTSLVFDIGTIGFDIRGVTWEYWNGAWVALAISASTLYSVANGFLGNAGVRSISFDQPSDWTANNPGMGVTGYWIRARITAVGAAPAAPTQQNRDIYTVVRPSVDIDKLQVTGDISALAQALVCEWSNILSGDSVILATRSADRGANFRMYLNLSSEQNVLGVSVTAGTNTTMTSYLEAPSGWAMRYNPGAGSVGDCSIVIDSAIAKDFMGRYRVYLRVDRESAITDCTVQLKAGLQDSGGGYTSYYYESEILTVASNEEGYLLDFGVIDIPGIGVIATNEEVMPITFFLSLANTTASPNLYLYDLILIPVDEWAGEFNVQDLDVTATGAESIGLIGLTDYNYLDVDSLDLKKRLSPNVRYSGGNELMFRWKDISSAPMQLQANKDQQLFGLLRKWNFTDDVWYADVRGLGSIQLFAAARYLSMRSDR